MKKISKQLIAFRIGLTSSGLLHMGAWSLVLGGKMTTFTMTNQTSVQRLNQ